ncbi:hypothetical protein GX51_00657 [Blastomyces parvus]|uniref:Uncharacterized protein n=1 Tax=Blastomyces parvus TaxID=2060905 RepID=A0A2B7XL87_9EURO|nr:hypothetical protein GX51_00657 [Blastomyces parvus]
MATSIIQTGVELECKVLRCMIPKSDVDLDSAAALSLRMGQRLKRRVLPEPRALPLQQGRRNDSLQGYFRMIAIVDSKEAVSAAKATSIQELLLLEATRCWLPYAIAMDLRSSLWDAAP